MKLWPILLGALAALALLAGCGSSSNGGSTSGASVPPPAQAVKDSSVEGVPVPGSAKLHHSAFGDLWRVPGFAYDELVRFYEDRLPEGEDFDGWKWCDTGGGEQEHAHIYSRGAREILNVTVTDDSPPGILIGTDQSGPC